MTAAEVYQKYHIAKNLQRHMYRVSAVGQFLCRHWKDTLNERDVVVTLLLHDMGNLLKFDLSRGVELFDPDERNVEHWQRLRQEMTERYGSDEHDATQTMASELGVSERVLELLHGMGSSNLALTVEGQDWEQKVISYSDLRVGPFGFLTVRERFDDILERYKGRSHGLSNQERVLRNRDACLKLEKQLQEQVAFNLQQLPSDELETAAENLALFPLP